MNTCWNCGDDVVFIGNTTAKYCGRCGTLLKDYGDTPTTPKLVKRCREFENFLIGIDATAILSKWERLVAESINLPEDRLRGDR